MASAFSSLNLGRETAEPSFKLSKFAEGVDEPKDGFLDNLVDDVENTVKGIPQGIVNTVTDPIGTIKQTAKGTWHNWSPLFRGDTDEWWDNFTEHPLGPMLDVFAVVSAGVGAPGTAASMAARAGKVAPNLAKKAQSSKAFQLANPEPRVLYPAGTSERLTPRGKLKKHLQEAASAEVKEFGSTKIDPTAPFVPSPDIVRHYRSNPIGRARQKGTDFLLESLAEQIPAFTYFSKEAKYHRLANKKISHRRVSGKMVAEAHKEAADLSSGKDHLNKLQRAVASSFLVRHLYSAGKVATEQPQVMAQIIDKQIWDQMQTHPVTLGKAEDLLAAHRGSKDGLVSGELGNEPNVMVDPNFLILRKDYLRPDEYVDFKTTTMKLPQFTERLSPDGEKLLTPNGFDERQIGEIGLSRGSQDPLFTQADAATAPVPQTAAAYGRYANVSDTESLLAYLNSAGRRMTMTMEEFLRHPERAALDADGNILGAANQRLHALTGEAHGSVEALAKLYTIPTSVWKFIVLGMRPAYLVNNVVGNMLMYYAANNPVEATWGLQQAIKDMKGERAAKLELSQLERELYKGGLDEDIVWPDASKRIKVDKSAVQMTTTGQGFSKDAGRQLSPDPEKFPRLAKAATLATVPARGMFALTDKISDSFVRNAAMHVAYRRDPRVISLMNEGLDYRSASRQAFNDPKVRARVENRVEKQLGQYYHFNKVEEQIKRLVPFYSWDRAILAHAGTLIEERPLTAGVAAEWSQAATEDNRGKLGDVPSSVLGSIGLDGFFGRGIDAGQKRLYLTSGINPYNTLADLTTAAKALTVGDNRGTQALAGQLNPILSTAFQGITGRSIVSNKPISGGGSFFATMAKGYLESLPQYRLMNTMIEGDSATYVDGRGKEREFLFKRDFSDQLASWLGISFRTMSEDTAQRLFAKERGIKQPDPPKPIDWASLIS